MHSPSGIEKCGAGNWRIISEYLVTKSAKQIEDHYWDSYMGVHGYCLPSSIIQDDKAINMEDYINRFDSDEKATLQSYYETDPIPGYSRGEEVIREREKTKDSSKSSKEKQRKIKEINNDNFNPDNFIEINGYELMMYKKKYYIRDLETNQLYDIQDNKPNNIIGIYTINGKVKLN
jgi:hypothetical protein